MLKQARETRLVTLRRQIQAAGSLARGLRWGTGAVVAGPVLPLALFLLLEYGPGYRGSALVLAFCGLAAAAGLPLALAYREWRSLALRSAVAGLPEADRAAVLLPLRRGCSGDIRRIIAPLLHSLPPEATELAPAAPPAGHGREPAVS